MTFSCASYDFSSAIDVVSRALAAKPVKESYGYIMIDATDDSCVSVSCTDGIIYMMANIEQAHVDECGIICLDGKLLSEIVRKQSGDEITLTSNGKNCTIKSGKAKTQMALRPANDFPSAPTVSDKSKTVKLPQGELRACIDYVEFCTSHDESRKILTGVLLELSKGQFCTVGLDGFRMALRKAACDYDGEETRIVIPKGSAVEISRLLKDGEKEPITLSMGKEYLHVWVGRYAVSTVLLSGEYIDYHKLIREECGTKALLDVRQLRGSVERAQIMARNGQKAMIFMRFNENTLTVTSSAIDGDTEEEMDVGLQGKPLTTAFNPAYLLDMLKREPDGQLDMECQGNVSPAIIRPLDQQDRLQLVLPVRILGGAA